MNCLIFSFTLLKKECREEIKSILSHDCVLLTQYQIDIEITNFKKLRNININLQLNIEIKSNYIQVILTLK